MKNSFEFIARGLIIKDNKILLCKRKEKNYYFLPGGHVELGETSMEALVREIKEERGTSLKNISFIGLIENIFKDSDGDHYEINSLFIANEINLENDLITKEDHLVFEFFSFSDFQKINVLPKILKRNILNWINDDKIFWNFEKQ